MKKIFAYSFFLLFILNNTLAKDGIFFLDIDYILNNSNHGKSIINELQDLSIKNNSIIKENEDKLKVEENEINKVKNIISRDELNKKIENLKKNVNEHRTLNKKMSDEFNTLKKNEIEKFFKKITPYIEEFMKAKSIKIILDKKNIFIADSNYDITNELIEFLNNKLN